MVTDDDEDGDEDEDDLFFSCLFSSTSVGPLLLSMELLMDG